MTVAPQAETEIVHGIIQGIVQKGTDDYGNPSKWQVEVNVGKQNPRRLWTSDPGLVSQLAMMVGQQQSFLCGISHWQFEGQPRRSLWINGVGQGAAVPQPPVAVQQPAAPPPVAPQPQAQWQQPQQQFPQQQPIMQQPPQQAPTVVQPMAVPMGPVAQLAPPQSAWDQKEDRIHRQTATKVASILISHVPAEQRTLDNVLALAERLVAYYENGLAQAVMQQPGQQDGDPGPQGIPQSDDDIPF